ncbi:MAG: Trk system potassium transporter TrkA [Lachnospiraceae bacterium]|nr:Trk system potassium transporter TrkA [Lachnospiraceae bacterium]
MNVIIVGCGNVGATLAAKLRNDNHNIVAIDRDKNQIDALADEEDLIGIVGDGLNYQVLLKAGIEHTDLLIAVTNSDEQNLLCCVMAKRSDQECRTIARVRNPIYNTEVSYLRRELGLALIINPELIAAADIARKFQYPASIGVETFTRGRIELLHLKIDADSPLKGVVVGQIKNRFKYNIVICSITRGKEFIIPGPNEMLAEGDELTISATPKDAHAFFKKIGLYKHPIKSALIVGGGTVGFYLAKRLTEVGIRTKIIEADADRCDLLNDEIPKAVIINGDGTDERLLLREGIGGVGAFAALTGVDEENVILTLFAKRVSHASTITKLRRINYTDIMKNLQVDSTVFPSLLTAEYIAKYAQTMFTGSCGKIENTFQIMDGKARIHEFFITKDHPYTGVPLSHLRFQKGAIICAITRNEKLIIPVGREELKVGDNVMVLTTISEISEFKDIIEQ